MSKRKRRGKHPSGWPPDYPRVLTGEIPWTAEEMNEAMLHASKLHGTPHDDWDRRAVGLTLREDDGSLTRLVFNPDMLINQMGNFLMSRFRAAGLSDELAMSHMWRFIEAQGFMAEHAQRLRAEHLIIDDPSDPDAALISSGLLKVLAEAPYDGVKLQGPNHDPVRTFHLERVIAKAKELSQDDDSPDDPPAAANH